VDQISQFITLNSIQGFLEDKHADWNARNEIGWAEELKSDLLIDTHTILANPKWKQLVDEKRDSVDDVEFWRVNHAAGILGIDLFETHWKRLNIKPTDPGLWFNVMRCANNERIDSIISLAEAKIPIDKIATGPADELGLGIEFNLHNCLDYLLQDLGDFPNKGFNLIKAGLKSPVTRNRHMAVKALSEWGHANWPEGTSDLLEQANNEEPDEDMKEDLAKLLARRKRE